MGERDALEAAKAYASTFELESALPCLRKLAESIDLDVRVEALGLLVDLELLAAEPESAMNHLLELSQIYEGTELAALFYSKALFLSNYRSRPLDKSLELHKGFDRFFRDVKRYYPPARPLEAHRVRKVNHSLRIGYISPDFRLHSVAYFMMPFIAQFDKSHHDVFCYMLKPGDDVTRRMKRFAVAWRDCSEKDADETARMIYDDNIDILVDLAGHTQDNALPVIARRPAPVIVSGVGYMSTTGMEETDYFLSDNVCMPPYEGDKGFTETVLRMKHHAHLCYAPDEIYRSSARSRLKDLSEAAIAEMPVGGWSLDAAREMPSPAEAPCLRNGFVTFGSFNNFAKVSESVIYTWREILLRVPYARLLIKCKLASIPSGRRIILERFKKAGIQEERIMLEPYSPDYLLSYRNVDIALDTFPYNGGLTTCEALYMGVPVITLRGGTHGSRFGASILERAGLSGFDASSTSDYISRAVRLAESRQLLRDMHRGLRRQLMNQPLMDSAGYMRELEGIWQQIAVSRQH